MSLTNSKKPRHRHTSEQLEQLNSLYAIDEHPSLEQRQTLAEALGMETKTVNSWFQNKRASQAKKASRIASLSDKRSTGAQDSDEFDPDYLPSSDPAKSKSRNRLSTEQVQALRNFFKANDMPTPAEREVLANQLAMSTQSVTNWFQNQRSLAKKSNAEDGPSEVPRQYSAFPPPTAHPSLPSLPPASQHPSIPSILHSRPPSASPEILSKGALRRSTTPYTPSSASTQRRRSRPEPHQLAALSALYQKTSNPSIQDRTTLAAESGMDLERVSNWFRNARQTEKRRRRSGESDVEPEYDHGDSPSPRSSPSPVSAHLERRRSESDMASDEEDEVITPPPDSVHGGEGRANSPYAPSPPPSSYSERLDIPLEWIDNDPLARADLDKRPRMDVEGALLLLSFHSCIVRV